MSSFVIVYDLVSGRSKIQEFAGAHAGKRALERRLEIESDSSDRLEVVAVRSESIETLEETHSRYFASGDYQLV